MWLIGEDQSFYETIFLHFQLHLLAKFTPFHFGMPNTPLALATDLRELR
jgi:hypothetical protein